MSCVGTLTLVASLGTCSGTGLPLGAHGARKRTERVTARSARAAALSAGGLQPLVNISAMSHAHRHSELMSCRISYRTPPPTPPSTISVNNLHSQIVNFMRALYIHLLSHTYRSFTVSQSHTLISAHSHTHTANTHSRRRSPFECAAAVIIHGRETGMSNQRPAH